MQTFLTTTRRRAISLTKTTFPISYTLYYHTHNYLHHSTMCTNTTIPYQSSHTFTCNPLKTPTPNNPFSPFSSLETLKSHLFTHTHDPISPIFKVLPFRKGRPLVGMSQNSILGPNWHLGWLGLTEIRALLSQNEVGLSESRVPLSENEVGLSESRVPLSQNEVVLSVDRFVYLGSKPEDDCVFWGVDVSKDDGLVDELGKKELSFVELRTLMVATDWSDAFAMGQLSIAGHARALLEWHGLSRFCGHCGCKTVPMEAGRRMHCSNELCKKRIYPRVDPVVIMLVIDRENDRALLGRQSRFVPRMWSCLAGFLEAGESLEEAVRRETWEETGIEVGEVIYHSSQPWPVGPSSMPCQLMVGFFAYAKSLEISVDKEELEDAQWHSREDVKKALSAIEYKKAQKTAASKVDQICKGVKLSQSLSSDFNNESGELPSMFVPGPFAIAHHLISSWAFQRSVSGGSTSETRLSSPVSNL